ncbi:hypothetical protein Q0N30_02085 [Priestia megaterium]|uniref:hypothetical protein n=1 Tax=Priestia megaterium TaxID=1404 RepID=UPI00345AD6A3
MKTLLKDLNQIKDELTDLFQKAEIYWKNKEIENGKEVLVAYKACAIKLRKMLLDNGFGNSEYFREFTNVYVADILQGIEPITNPRRIELLKKQIDQDIYYLGQDMGYVEECMETGLPLIRNLNVRENLSEVEYEQIIRDIYKYGTFMSGARDSYKKLGEIPLRDMLLNNLNFIYNNLIVTGETFNKGGRTDIILKNMNKINVFIAECKMWDGPQYSIIEALDQLLDNYVTEHDRKISLIIFNDEVRIETATDGIEKHVIPHLKSKNLSPARIIGKFSEENYVYYYQIEHPLDSSQIVELTVILININ